jgi:hypothetical protein
LKTGFLTGFLISLFFTNSIAAQSCSCDQFHTKLFSLYDGKNLRLRVCGEELDRYQKDKIISEFFVTDCRKDSMLLNTIHDEGDAFLLQPVKNGFSITLIALPFDKNDKTPAFFDSFFFYIKNGRIQTREKKLNSKPIIQYLKKFLKYQEIK